MFRPRLRPSEEAGTSGSYFPLRTKGKGRIASEMLVGLGKVFGRSLCFLCSSNDSETPVKGVRRAKNCISSDDDDEEDVMQNRPSTSKMRTPSKTASRTPSKTPSKALSKTPSLERLTSSANRAFLQPSKLVQIEIFF